MEKPRVSVEKREAHEVTQLIASGLGGILGGEVGALLGLSSVGRALAALSGAIAGHCAVTYRIVIERRDGGETSPMTYSDRR